MTLEKRCLEESCVKMYKEEWRAANVIQTRCLVSDQIFTNFDELNDKSTCYQLTANERVEFQEKL